MEIIEVATGKRRAVSIDLVDPDDFKKLTTKRYFFNWRLQKKRIVYKLHLAGDDDILGVMSLIDHPDEMRIEIKLLASSRENTRATKIFDNIAGCLIAFACKESLNRYGERACVSLVPKTTYKPHYIKKYKMQDAGLQVFLDGEELHNMIKQYLV